MELTGSNRRLRKGWYNRASSGKHVGQVEAQVTPPALVLRRAEAPEAAERPGAPRPWIVQGRSAVVMQLSQTVAYALNQPTGLLGAPSELQLLTVCTTELTMRPLLSCLTLKASS